MPKKEEGIGAWMTIIEIISLIGVVTNSAMIIMTFKAREEFAKYLNASNVHSVGEYIGGSSSDSYTGGSGSTRSAIRNKISNSSVFNSRPVDYLSSEVNFLWLMVAVEHCVIILKLVLREYIEGKEGIFVGGAGVVSGSELGGAGGLTEICFFSFSCPFFVCSSRCAALGGGSGDCRTSRRRSGGRN